MANDLNTASLTQDSAISVGIDSVARMPDGRILRLAIENPWYVLMTVAGEPMDPDDTALVAANRRIWNAWACTSMSLADRTDLAQRLDVDEAALELLTPAEVKAIGQAARRRLPNPAKTDDSPSAALIRALRGLGAVLRDLPSAEAPIDLSGCLFDARVALQGYVFPGEARFDGAWFRVEAMFDGAIFLSQASFAGATFEKDARFSAVHVFDEARFPKARFQADTRFDKARFHRQADFEAARFAGRADFSGTDFRWKVGFPGAVFGAETAWPNANFYGPCDFDGAQFAGPVRGAKALYADQVTFNGATFQDRASFSGSRFKTDAAFHEATFEKPVSFEGSAFEARYPDLSGAQFHKDVTVSATDWVSVRKTNGAPHLASAWPRRVEGEADILHARGTAATLRHAMARQTAPEAEHFFYRKEMGLTARIGHVFERLPYLLYGAFSNFGHSIALPFIWLCATVLVPWFVYLFVKGACFGPVGCLMDSPPLEPLRALGQSFANTFGVLGFQRLYFDTASLPWWMHLAGGIQTVLGLVFLVLLAIGLRTRFRLR